MNSKRVLRFSGDGDVTKMLEYPKATAEATARPKAADLPRPRAAVRATVDLQERRKPGEVTFSVILYMMNS
jgi:hypothetical protein